ncbi:uncharacterized protein SPPG_06566 [Spizellomyces punctatus DAOM BR117]|uniref:MYND-type domain-containing protein n=1 Tax=Spizellomyces punctatus (strain DAOM BR117) TaxID=645134 RepID=A0A0L0HAI3_SPIPD|nr:uncharacterized protein SPPG_06566 [Spizellomyces punctatus DAOM BR117]KNC98162.1 hypothetical protein SPPG_06566 [Spizellomyces punctatus DAOM BR117]|eukprot:XP_016606202.1 hypothetical protein SPPG_06566 [Spizellomyces punctatus DAOM BR117]
MADGPKPYTEEDREREKVESLRLASSIPQNGARWELTVQQAGVANDSRPVYLATVRAAATCSEAAVLNFESFPGAPPSLDDLYAFLCRAICFPMSRQNAARPQVVQISSHSNTEDELSGKAEFQSTLQYLAQKARSELEVAIIFEGEKGARSSEVTNADGLGSTKQMQSSPSSGRFACHVCSKRLPAASISRCSSCKAMNYCSRECQAVDWPQHKTYCNILKTHMSRAPELRDFGLEVDRRLLDDRADLHGYLSDTCILGHGLWRTDLIQGTFDLVARMRVSESVVATEAFPKTLCPFSTPLSPDSGFRDTPAAICGWKDYYKAKSIPKNSPACLLLSNALTLFHGLTHLFPRSSLPISRGSYVCLHIIESSQTDVELAATYECLAALLPQVTVDIFIIAREIVVIPITSTDYTVHATITEQEQGGKLTLNHPAVFARRQYSVEYKNSELECCVRVHFARSSYSDFPRDKYPPHLIVCHDAATKLFIDASMDAEEAKASRQTLDAILSQKTNVIFAERTELDAEQVAKALKKTNAGIHARVKVNPFRQPLTRQLTSEVNIPCYANGFVVPFTVS